MALPAIVVGCAGHETAAPKLPSKATATVSRSTSASRIAVAYREAANVFEILDNLSDWLPGKCDEEYRAYWKQRFGITPEDEQRFASYKQARKRTYPRPREEGGTDPRGAVSLFGPLKPVDRFAEAFYGSDSLRDAFAALANVVNADDLAELKAFYAAYRPQVDLLLAESRPYETIAAAMREKLNAARADAFAGDVARFYGVADLPQFTALYVWWPPVENVSANTRGAYLLLKYNPAKHAETASRSIDIPVHELVHYVSSHQPEERKRSLSRTFLAGCDPTADVKPVKILEEPMAVAQQKLFLSIAAPEQLDLVAPWYGGDRWIDPFAKALYPQVKEARAQGRTIDDALMTTAAASCAELHASRSATRAP